ncbi:DUF397 domain-containing protein [Streptomyces sp. NPDC048665]|uniref:DUF397 domain-containing protein n=1 Tax=Streptomyces sp. NPDC048665 TaxID=3155490 RepID=UPI00341FD691
MPHFEFVKSSHSSGDGECVEVARNLPHTIALRDSKNPAGAIVTVGPRAWRAFPAHLARRR